MSMKLSYRDKVFIIIAAVVVVLVAGFFAFIKPKYAELQVSKSNVAAKEAEKQEVEEKIATLEFLESALKNNVETVEELQDAFVSEKDYGRTDLVGQYITELLAPSGIEIKGMTYSDMEDVTLDAYAYDKNAVAYQLKIDSDLNMELPQEVYDKFNDTYPEPPVGVTVAGTLVTVNYECSPDIKELLEVFDIISESDKTIYMTTVSSSMEYTESEDGGEPVGTGDISIMVYEIYPMDVDSVK